MNTKDTDTIQHMERVLGIRCDYSNWWIARELLRQEWKKSPGVIRDTTKDLRDLPFTESALDTIFVRGITLDMVGKTCHHFDKNSAYLSACRSVKCGIGDPVHLTENITPGLPGIYRVSWAINGSAFDDRSWPSIIDAKQQWITNDVLLYALKHGYEITIHEAYVFGDYKPILDKWAKRIWDARQALKDVHAGAYLEMKRIAIIGNGAWATGKDKHAGIDLIHPNWWADVVGKTRVNMLANIDKFKLAPVLVYSDGLWYVTRDDNYRSAVPGILDRMGQLGGYKHVYSFTITPELRAASLGMGAGELRTLFNKIGKHHETI